MDWTAGRRMRRRTRALAFAGHMAVAIAGLLVGIIAWERTGAWWPGAVGLLVLFLYDVGVIAVASRLEKTR